MSGARSAAPAGTRVLVVDDDPSIRDLVTTALDFTGYEVTAVANGREALAAAAASSFSLVVLDVMLPDLDGFETCRRLRADGVTTPVIFLTAKDAPTDTVEGLASGGDDYLVKPFHLQVLLARIEAVLRRAGTGPSPSNVLTFADLELDTDAHQVRRSGALVGLSPTEFRLLAFFLHNPGIVLSKERIVEHVWQYDFDGEYSIVETNISYLRKKLGPPPLIQTVRGVGYVLRRVDDTGS